MKISSAILKPNLNQIQNSFEELYQEIGFNALPEAVNLKSDIQSHLRQLSNLKESILGLETHSDVLIPGEFHGAYKTFKYELRSARRIWDRINSNQTRIRKMQERRTHASSVAA